MGQYFTASVKRGAMYYAIISIVFGIISFLLGIAIVIVPPIAFLACLSLPLMCIAAVAIPIGIGWFVAQWGSATDMAKGAMDGAIACGVGGLIAGAVNWVLGICSGLATYFLVTSALGGDMVSTLIGSVGGGLLSWIGGAIFAAISGAVGGLLYVAIQGNKGKPA